MKLLIVIDMQKDFTYGALRNEQAIAIIPNVCEKVKNALNDDDTRVIFTRDTHFENYMDTQEGRKLPVPHCIKDGDGWMLVDELEKLKNDNSCTVFDKPTFGSVELMQEVIGQSIVNDIESIELIGVCTDICVISNAMLVKAALPEVTVRVDSSCCAGVTAEAHDTALNAMKSCQIEVY